MIWKNAELHNVADIIEQEDGGVLLLRVPKHTREGLNSDGKREIDSTGVEIRFVLKGETAKIKIASGDETAKAGTFRCFRGGIQGSWTDNAILMLDADSPNELVVKASKNLGNLKFMTEKAGLEWDPQVIRILLDSGIYKLYDIEGDIEPPTPAQTPKKTLLCYGSSITHGSNALSAPQAWVSVLSDKLGMDRRNLGMAGNCKLEPAMAEYIASEGEKGNWDIAVLELGINVLSWDETEIRQKSENMIRQVAGRNPKKPIFVVSPFCFYGDDLGNSESGEKWRRILKEVTEESGFKNVTYINGTDIIGDSSLYISADEVHPNIYGCMKIAEKLEEKIREVLNV